MSKLQSEKHGLSSTDKVALVLSLIRDPDETLLHNQAVANKVEPDELMEWYEVFMAGGKNLLEKTAAGGRKKRITELESQVCHLNGLNDSLFTQLQAERRQNHVANRQLSEIQKTEADRLRQAADLFKTREQLAAEEKERQGGGDPDLPF